MTPETPDPPPVSPDPWDSVHEEFADMSQWETARVYRADAVDAARAADAALLRERDAQIAKLQEWNDAQRVQLEAAEAQIASLTAQVEQWEREHDARADEAAREAARADELVAERDAAQQERDEAKHAAITAHVEFTKDALRRIRAERQAEIDVLQQENQTLREALANADEGIVRGQACRSQGEFNAWMHDVQAMRPHASLLSSSPRPQEPQP